MPFRSDPFIGTYNPDQLRKLQRAYDETCKLLEVVFERIRSKKTGKTSIRHL